MTRAFDELMSCSGKWHVEAKGDVRDFYTWKRSGGAKEIVTRKPTKLAYVAPDVIATNVTPPSMQVGRQTLHFFPDAVFVVSGKQVGAIRYSNLDVQWKQSAFIEEKSGSG